MPRRSSSPARKRSAPSSSDSEGKPDIKPKAEPNAKANPGRLDTQSRAALAAIVIQRGIASTLAEVDTVTIETGLTPQQIRNQLNPGRQNLRKFLETATSEDKM